MRICIVYIRAYIVLVCIGIYIYAHVHFMHLQRFAAARFIRLQPSQPLQHVFDQKPLFMLLPYLLPFCPFAFLAFLPCVPCVPFAVPLYSNACNVHFKRFFKRFLSGLFVHVYICTVCTVCTV